jgi:hypothetical protein
MPPVRHELGIYIQEDGILHSHRRKNLQSNIIIICKIRGFHGGDYKEWCLLVCYAVWLL